jgi:hypothetical protein
MTVSGTESPALPARSKTPEVHRDSDFRELYKAIEERLKGGFPPPPDADRQESKPATGAPPDVQYFEPITALVPEGPFLMGSLEPNGAPGHELPQHMTRLLSCGM